MCDKKCQTAGFGSSIQASRHGGTARSEYPHDRLQQLEKEADHWERQCRAVVKQRDDTADTLADRETELKQHQKCVQDICHVSGINDGYSLQEISGTVYAREKLLQTIIREFPPAFTLNEKEISPDNIVHAVRYAVDKMQRYWKRNQDLEVSKNAHKNICQLAGEQDELIKEQQRRLAELEQFAHAVKLAVGYDVGYAASLEGIIASVKNASQSTPSVKLMSLQEIAADAINHMITSGDWMQYPETRQHVCNLSHDHASFNRKS